MDKLKIVGFWLFAIIGLAAPKVLKDSGLSLAEQAASQLVTEFYIKRLTIDELLEHGRWKDALLETDSCQTLADSASVHYLDRSYHRAEAYLGMGQPSEALYEISLDKSSLTRNALSRELALAMQDQLSNEQVNELVRPVISMFEKENENWARRKGVKLSEETKTFPVATDHKSRLALVHVARAHSLGSNVAIREREARLALEQEPSNCLAAYYLVTALKRLKRPNEEQKYLPILALMPGKHGADAQNKINALKKRKIN